MSEHTPGPWKTESPEGTIVREPHGGTICQLKFLAGPHGLGGRRPNDEVEANARLIAAAPDMLAALKDLHDDCVEYARINNLHNSDGSPATNHAIRRARAAIAKATVVLKTKGEIAAEMLETGSAGTGSA